MKKLFILAIFFGLTANVFGYSNNLEWSSDKNSIQAVLWNALSDLGAKYEKVDPENNPVNRKDEDSAIFIRDLEPEENHIMCQRSLMKSTPQAIKKYQCQFDLEDTDLGWTQDARSVQALLYEALVDYFNTYPDQQAIQLLDDGKSVLLMDEETRLIHVKSECLGAAAVQSYRAEFNFKDQDKEEDSGDQYPIGELPMTKIENPVLICEDSGVKYAFEGFDKRVWQSDPGQDEGIQLKVDDFKQVVRTPYDWEVLGSYSIMGQSLNLKLRTKSKTVYSESSRQVTYDVKLDIMMKRPEDRSYKSVKVNVPCRVVAPR